MRNFAVAPALAASLLLAQTPSQPRLASFNIVALDRHGQPVTDLRDSELKIEDNGAPRQIALLRSASGAPQTTVVLPVP
jgi:hypothetical protein